MNRQPHSATREVIVANAIRDVVSELRMIEVADYIAFIRLESMASIADIVESAAELYFMPGTLRFGLGGEARVAWGEIPSILLDLELRPTGASVYFTLTLDAAHAAVEVNYIAFEQPSDDPEQNTHFLEETLAVARLRRTQAA